MYDESEELLESALELDPGNKLAKENLAILRRSRSATGKSKFGNEDESEETEEQSSLSYREAVLASEGGRVNREVLGALRREHAIVQRSGSAERRISVKGNLGAALLTFANALAEPAEYGALYAESEEVLLSVLELDPNNDKADRNLAIVRWNRKQRPSTAASAQSLGERGGKGAQSFVSTVDDLERPSASDEGSTKSDTDRSSSSNSKQSSVPLAQGPLGAGRGMLTYDDAIAAARGGRIDLAVVEAMRREDATLEMEGEYLVRHVDVKANLGAALLDLGNQATDPAEYEALYAESEEVLRYALELNPDSQGAKENLEGVRRNVQARRDEMPRQ
jgi:tetratricopeptide (TPR) repeat protein